MENLRVTQDWVLEEPDLHQVKSTKPTAVAAIVVVVVAAATGTYLSLHVDKIKSLSRCIQPQATWSDQKRGKYWENTIMINDIYMFDEISIGRKNYQG